MRASPCSFREQQRSRGVLYATVSVGSSLKSVASHAVLSLEGRVSATTEVVSDCCVERDGHVVEIARVGPGRHERQIVGRELLVLSAVVDLIRGIVAYCLLIDGGRHIVVISKQLSLLKSIRHELAVNMVGRVSILHKKAIEAMSRGAESWKRSLQPGIEALAVSV